MRFLLPISIFCCALFIAWWLVSSGQLGQSVADRANNAQLASSDSLSIKPVLDPETLPFVRTGVFRPARWKMPLIATGVVKPVSQVSLLAEVDGQIRKIHPAVKENGIIPKGEIIFLLYSPQAEAQLVAARSKLQQARQQFAQTEAQLNSAGDVPGLETPLKYRQGLLLTQRALIEAAHSEVALAQDQVNRQKMRAPFDARVIDQGFSSGQMIRTGTELARIFEPGLLVVDIGLSPANASLLRKSAQPKADTHVVVARAIGDSYDYFKGQLQSKRGVIDVSSGTESLQIKVMQNQESVQLMPGEHVDVRISVEIDQLTLRVPHAYLRQDQLFGVRLQQQKSHNVPIGEVVRYDYEPVLRDRQFVYLKIKSQHTPVVLIQNSPDWLLPGHQVRLNSGNQLNDEKVSLQHYSELEQGV